MTEISKTISYPVWVLKGDDYDMVCTEYPVQYIDISYPKIMTCVKRVTIL